jgi:primosomal protein N' (replication factor Y)
VPTIAQVEPITTARALRGPFDYRLPARLDGTGVGSVLSVPFGGRTALGVVTRMAESSDVPAERLVEPLERAGHPIPEELVELALWMADEYVSTPARALQLVLPPGVARRAGPRVVLEAELTEAGRAAAGATLAAGASSAGARPRLTERQRAVIAALAAGPRSARELGVEHGALRRLEARGLLTVRPVERLRRPVGERVGALAGAPAALTPEQDAALAALAAEPTGRFLLHGVTGSGKTEVYLRAAADALRRGRGAIVLVPEIALTPQTVARFRARLGDTVAVLHSGLSAGERHDEWLRLARGDARVCVGPRSAVFAPLPELGLVVVDEEHDSSYKHEGDPRYDARRVAAWRAERAGALLIMGSATPRPESVRALHRVALSHRVDGRPLPPVEVLDMRDARHSLHPATREALAATQRTGGKAIVLLNRRGWSNFVSCRHCGRVWECPECDVALVLHRGAGSVACHHCGHRERVPSRCPDCGSPGVARHGTGTERLEAELAEALGGEGFPIFRLDADAAARRGVLLHTLQAFERAPAGVLVGTQMVAKGHDFPDVTLGVVLDADATLRFPDFRAEERTFALVAQLAGRAGRGAAGGRVFVQTLAPEAECIRAAARHDATGFLADELRRREALGYPPFATLIRIVCSAPEAAAAQAAAAAIAGRIGAPGATVLGPAPLFRLRGRERRQLVVKATRRRAAVAAVREAVEAIAATKVGRAASLSVDVDPQ